MKTNTKNILATLVSCYLFASWQDVEEPTNTIPTVRTDAVTVIGMRDALVSGSVTSKSNCKFLLSTQPDLSEAIDFNARCIVTYFLLRKLKDSKGDVTLKELGDYVIENVSREAINVNEKEQTPTIRASVSLGDSWQKRTLR